jgi:hypothetical protein
MLFDVAECLLFWLAALLVFGGVLSSICVRGVALRSDVREYDEAMKPI